MFSAVAAVVVRAPGIEEDESSTPGCGKGAEIEHALRGPSQRGKEDDKSQEKR